jgi:TnpA family transposase
MSRFSLDDLGADDDFPQRGDRLQILSAEEYEALWGFPRFTQRDRDLFFALTAPEREVLEQRRSIRTKIHFMLHLGYFRARQRFFRFELPAVRDDVDYLRRRYFENKAVADVTVSDHTRKRHVEQILGLFRYRLCALEERLLREAHARQAARHSSKYFGLKQGVVSYTLLANHVPLNARIIGANEHESHFVFDILFNNATDILPAIHSTDTHGTNHVNFALLHPVGYRFAPRYRDVKRQVKNGLCGFRHPTHYDKDWPIKPNRRVREGLILSEEDNIERILLSLALKSTIQSVIVGKLSAQRRKNRTQRALWEFDSIIRILYLLDYIDSPVLRRNVQRALNRGEAYHQLSPTRTAAGSESDPSMSRRSGTSVPGWSATR